MTSSILIVGSGASGVHFALSLLQRGHSVTMLDVGRRGSAPVAPDSSFNELKSQLADPSEYFLGPSYEGVLWPDTSEEYYGIPPTKGHALERNVDARYSPSGFAPLSSLARGGFGEVWTGGCYPLNDGEVAEFPFSYGELSPHYDEVARRIGITGEQDDLARFMPTHDHLLPPLRLDSHSTKLLNTYERKRERLNRSGAYLGRTRVATLSRDMESRQACDYLGRCLWGCPRGALYTPSHTLQDCQSYTNFEYVPGFEIEHFRVGPGSRIRSIVGRPIDGGAPQEFPLDHLALAAGTLASTRIFLLSMLREMGQRIQLPGLMDNRQVLVPFVNLQMIGKPFSPDSYQYHLLGMGFESETPGDYIHAQITTLKTAMLHPIIQRLPFDMSSSTLVMRSMHSALGVVNVNFRDTRRAENHVGLVEDRDTPRLTVRYAPSADEPSRMSEAVHRVKKALRTLGCIVPPGMTHVRPMGSSVHYAGTLPMTDKAAPFTTTEYCQSRDFENLFVVDGSTFPFLPAKNITFTLMANAVRIAETAF